MIFTDKITVYYPIIKMKLIASRLWVVRIGMMGFVGVNLLTQSVSSSDWNQVTLDGFADLNISQQWNRTKLTENTAINTPNKYDRELNFKALSTLGLQLSAQLTDNSRLVSQLIGKGEKNDFDLVADWVYYQYEFDPSWSMKFGRMRTPFFLLSEYLDVKYAVPWADLPDEVYDILEPFSNYEAFEMLYHKEMGAGNLSIQTQYGRLMSDAWDIQEVLSSNILWNNDPVTFRLGVARGDTVALEDNALLSKPSLINANIYNKHHIVEGNSYEAWFYSAAMRFDNGTWLSIVEWTRLTVEGLTVDQDAYYVTLGKRWHQWTGHLTYGDAKSQDNDIRARNAVASSINVDLYRWAVGLRWDFAKGTALKLQYEVLENQIPANDEQIRSAIMGINTVF